MNAWTVARRLRLSTVLEGKSIMCSDEVYGVVRLPPIVLEEV